MSDCPICYGSQYITLPLRYGLAAFSQRDLMSAPETEMEETARQYPCPECNKARSGAKTIRSSVVLNSSYMKEAAYVESVKAGLANRIASTMVQMGLVEFEQYRRPPDSFEDCYVMTATLACLTTAQARAIGPLRDEPEVEKPKAKRRAEPKPLPPPSRFGELIFQDEEIEP